MVFFPSLPQPSKLSNDLVQQFLLPDQTPPILEAEMSLRAEQLEDEQINHDAGAEARTQQHSRSEERRRRTGRKEAEEEEERVEAREQAEERLQPEGRQAEAVEPESDRRQVGVWVGSRVCPADWGDA